MLEKQLVLKDHSETQLVQQQIKLVVSIKYFYYNLVIMLFTPGDNV